MAIQRYRIEGVNFWPVPDDAAHYVSYPDHAAIVRDLEDRLRLFSGATCTRCGCAPAHLVDGALCKDCNGLKRTNPAALSCAVSIGMRALCGRKLLPEPEGGR